MLILTRRVGERILIGEDIWVTVCAISGNQVKLGFDAPVEMHVQREELIGQVPVAPHPGRVYVGAADVTIGKKGT